MFIAIIIGIVLFVLYQTNKPIKNSHKIPQRVEIGSDDKALSGRFILSRNRYHDGFHLVMGLEVEDYDLDEINQLTLRWVDKIMDAPMYDFKFYKNGHQSGQTFYVKNNQIIVDLGSFQNCPSSKNFLSRINSVTGAGIIIYFSKDEKRRIITDNKELDDPKNAIRFITRNNNNLKEFSKGLHYIDS